MVATSTDAILAYKDKLAAPPSMASDTVKLGPKMVLMISSLS
jgi:hypothetical protein